MSIFDDIDKLINDPNELFTQSLSQGSFVDRMLDDDEEGSWEDISFDDDNDDIDIDDDLYNPYLDDDLDIEDDIDDLYDSDEF